MKEFKDVAEFRQDAISRMKKPHIPIAPGVFEKFMERRGYVLDEIIMWCPLELRVVFLSFGYGQFWEHFDSKKLESFHIAYIGVRQPEFMVKMDMEKVKAIDLANMLLDCPWFMSFVQIQQPTESDHLEYLEARGYKHDT